MDHEFIRYRHADHIAHLVIDRPDCRNGFSLSEPTGKRRPMIQQTLENVEIRQQRLQQIQQ
jgi:1,4-dihydroxy-2-naphthoyl-CoA synthase